jgi:hypothetical protein
MTMIQGVDSSVTSATTTSEQYQLSDKQAAQLSEKGILGIDYMPIPQSSTPLSMTEQLAKQNPNYIPKTAQGGAIVDEFLTGHDEVNVPEVPKTATTERVTKIERLDENTYRETTVKSHLDEMTVTQVVNGIMIPNMRVMLASVLGTIDASVPNKDQNKAIKHLVRKQFDDAYCEIMRRAYPDCGFATDMDYIVSPEPNRAKAYAEGFFK